jgi:hypothetical protein
VRGIAINANTNYTRQLFRDTLYDNSNPAPLLIAVRSFSRIPCAVLKFGSFRVLKQVDAVGSRCTSFAIPKPISVAAKNPPPPTRLVPPTTSGLHLTLYTVNGGCRCANPCTGGEDDDVTNRRNFFLFSGESSRTWR